jgi:hypothetical protein
VYWKQRAIIHWVKFGDENTKLFHSIATQKFRRKHIASMQALDGSLATGHEHKAAILQNSFKDRLGQSEFQSMFIELDSLIHPTDLTPLDAPFSIAEIDAIVKDLLIDRWFQWLVHQELLAPHQGGFL